MTISNEKYNVVFLTITRNISIDGVPLYIGAQYKWLQKKEVSTSTCGCTPKTWSYLVTETARGEQLEKAIWIPDMAGIEDSELRVEITNSIWNERRDTGEGVDWSVPNHLRKFDTDVLDKDGYVKVS